MSQIDSDFNSSLEYLFDNIDEFGQFDKTDVFIVRSDIEVEINFPFSIEEKELKLSKKEIIEQIEEFKTYTLNDKKNRIKTNRAIYHIISEGNYSSMRYLDNEVEIKSLSNKVSIEICYDKAFLLGIIALKEGAYHKEYYSPLEYSPTIKIDLGENREELNEEKENQMLTAFRFELLSNQDLYIELGEFITDWDFDEEEETDDVVKKQLKLKPLLPYEEGMKMYLVTESIYDDEFKYLSLYKILEHYSSVALRVDVLEGLAKKLDSPKSLSPDSKYLASIIELASSFELRKRDKELIRTVLQRSVDIVDLVDLFPQFIKEKLNGNDISYQTKKGEIDKVSSRIADILYSTRNYFAHAKANYELTGLECQLNNWTN